MDKSKSLRHVAYIVLKMLKHHYASEGALTKLIGYLDFDGVILDSETGLFDEYYKLKEKGVEISKVQYLQNMDWNVWLERAPILNGSIELLKNNPPECVSILTLIHSFEEGKAKTDYLRRNGVKNDVILVPYNSRKHEIIDPRGRFLVDDSDRNLSGWRDNGGFAIKFAKTVTKNESPNEFVQVSSLAWIFNCIREISDNSGCDLNTIISYMKTYLQMPA